MKTKLLSLKFINILSYFLGSICWFLLLTYYISNTLDTNIGIKILVFITTIFFILITIEILFNLFTKKYIKALKICLFSILVALSTMYKVSSVDTIWILLSISTSLYLLTLIMLKWLAHIAVNSIMKDKLRNVHDIHKLWSYDVYPKDYKIIFDLESNKTTLACTVCTTFVIPIVLTQIKSMKAGLIYDENN